METSPLITQVWTWINTITLPGLALAIWKFSRWVANKEQEARASLAGMAASIENLKDNHLHHIQETLDGIKTGQGKMAEQMTENTRDIVAATNSSKDAIVAAVIASRS